MRKHEELNNPESCMSRAFRNEMTFVLLGRDVASPATIRFWAEERIRLGKNKMSDPQIIEALHCAGQMEKERIGEHRIKQLMELGVVFGPAFTGNNVREMSEAEFVEALEGAKRGELGYGQIKEGGV